MVQASRTFRIFVSSTFNDLKEERNALQQHVFPELRKLCMERGARFQAIDLRWGVSEEAGLDQRTMNICLDEIERCRRITPRPNFIVLLGDRYGWRPLPSQIPAHEFDEICQRISGDEKTRLERWYLRDDNAVPVEHCLRPRDPTGEYADYDAWSLVEDELRSILFKAVKDMPLDAYDRMKYEASATEQEIARGALRVEDAREHVYCFFRAIKTKNNMPLVEDLPPEGEARDFVDLVKVDGEYQLDADAHRHLEDLSKKLHGLFPDNICEYEPQWTGLRSVTTNRIDRQCQEILDGISRHIAELAREKGAFQPDSKTCDRLNELKNQELRKHLPENLANAESRTIQATTTIDHIPKLCADVYAALSCIILQEVARLKDVDPLKREIADHADFGKELAKFFIGRADMLNRIGAYIKSADAHPLAVWGESGSGKSALMARAAQQVRDDFPDAEIVLRFIGRTPGSSDIRTLLESLCLQVSRAYGADESTVPTDYRELVDEFPKRLALATPHKPLIVFLDALDQLSDAEGGRSLVWLPRELPDHVRLIVSTLRCECKSALESKLPKVSLEELRPMPRDEGRELLDVWLKEARRTLRQHQREEVLNKFESEGRPLYLKLAFDEAKHWKSYTEPGKTVLSEDIQGIIENNLFDRLASNANHGEMMVSRSLGYLVTAKNGLSEDEMLDVLSKDSDVLSDFRRRAPKSPPVDRLPVVVWSRLYFDLEPYLTNRSVDGASLMTFYHRQLREAVVKHYLARDTDKRERHRGLALYFGAQGLEIKGAPNLRKMSELPYQQTYAETWEELQATLTDFDFVYGKTQGVGPEPLIGDYDEASRAGYEGTDLPLVQGALRLSAHIVRKDAGQLPGQLVGRLLAQDAPAVQKLVSQAGRWCQTPWLRPLTPALTQSGGPLQRTLGGHGGAVLSLALDPTSHRLIVGCLDHTLWVWDLDRFELMDRVELPRSFDGLISGKLHPLLEVVLAGTEGGFELRGYEFAPLRIAVLPDARHLLISIDRDRSLWLWDMHEREQTHVLRGHLSQISGVAVTPDGARAVSGSADGTVRIWDLRQRSSRVLVPCHTLVGHSGRVTCVAVTPDGRHVVSGSEDKTIRVWAMDDGKLLRTIHTGAPIHELAVTPDAQSIVSANADGQLQVWAFERGVSRVKALMGRGMVHNLEGHRRGVMALAVTPEGHRAVSAGLGGSLKVWDIRQGTFLFDLATDSLDPYFVTSIAVTADGRYALVGRADRTAGVWKLDDPGGPARPTLAAGFIRSLAITPDGRVAVSGADDGTVGVWDARTNTLLHAMGGHDGPVPTVAVTPDGHIGVSAGHDRTVRVWDLTLGEQVSRLTGHHQAVYTVAVTDDGRYALSGSGDGTIRVWDVAAENKKEVACLTGHEGSVSALALTADGTRALSSGYDGTLRLWNLRHVVRAMDSPSVMADLLSLLVDERSEEQPMRILRRRARVMDTLESLWTPKWDWTLAMTPRGEIALVGGREGALEIWDLEKVRKRTTLASEGPAVRSVSLARDNTPLCMCARGRKVEIWNLREAKIVAAFTGDADFVACATAANGILSVAADMAGLLHIFRLTPGTPEGGGS